MEIIVAIVVIGVLCIPGLALVAGGLALLTNAIERMSRK